MYACACKSPSSSTAETVIVTAQWYCKQEELNNAEKLRNMAHVIVASEYSHSVLTTHDPWQSIVG